MPDDNFRSWLSTSSRKPVTIKNLLCLVRLLRKRGVNFVSISSVSDFLLKLKIENISSSHINNFINCIRVLTHFFDDYKIPYDTELKTLRYVKDKYRPRSTMTNKEIEDFLELPRIGNTGNFKHEYWKVFFSILAYTGMRTIETASLKVENVDFNQGIFYLIDTKTNENRLVPIPPNIEPIVYRWVQKTGKGFLFPSHRPEGHTSSVEWGYQYHVRLKRLGINRPNLTPYSLRHSYITEMLQTEGVNIFDVKNLVGHHNIKTTENYYHLTTKRLKKVVNKHPGVRGSTTPQEVFKGIEEYIDGLGLDHRFKVNKKVSGKSIEFKIEL